MVEKGKKVIAQPINGTWMTTGDPLTYMQTQVMFALERSDIGGDFAKFLSGLNFQKYLGTKDKR